MRIGVIANRTKAGVEEVHNRIRGWAAARNVTLITISEEDSPRELKDALDTSEMVITLGGDGTLLGAARLVGESETPILGVNLGKFGFLTESGVGELAENLEKILAADYAIVSRMNLSGRVEGQRGGPLRFTALNDAVVHRAAATRIGHFETYVGGERVNAYTADGLILSTPTGSTAYNLSAGGPLVSPEMRAIVVTPICPHTLGIRPLVLPDHEEIQIKFPEENEELRLTVDGQEGFTLTSDSIVTVGAAGYSTRLVRIGGPRFFEVLRQKLFWGKRE